MAAAKKKTYSSRKQTTVNSRTKGGTAKKTTSRSSKSGTKRSTSKTGTRTSRQRRTEEEINEYKDKLAFELGVTILVIAIISLFLYLCFFGFAGKAGIVVGGLFFGFFGWFAWFVPVVAVLGSTVYLANKGNKKFWRKTIGFTGIVLSVLGLCDLLLGNQIITEYYTSNHVMHPAYAECMFMTCEDVMTKGKGNAGLIGRAVSSLFSGVLGNIGAVLLLFALLLFCVYIFYGMEMMKMIRKRNAYRDTMQEAYEQISDEEEYTEPSYRVFSSKANARKNNSPERVTSAEPLERENIGNVRAQTFDLKKINERLDRMEQTMLKRMEEQKKTANKEDIGMQAVNKEEQKKTVGKEDIGMQAVNKADLLTETATVEPVGVASPEEKDIPIYRNEMKLKFGENKKKSAKKTAFVDEEKRNVMLMEDEVTLSQNEQESLPSDVTPQDNEHESPTNHLPEPSEQKPPVEHLPESSEQKTSPAELTKQQETQQPIQLPKEDTVKKEESAISTGAVAMAKAMAQDRDHTRTVKEHGKFGGNDYVSASETFNALNESKVAIEEDKPYEFPPLDLLSQPKNAESSVSDSELRITASKLQDTLKSFNVNVKMGAVICGPTVTRYELLPEQGVRVNKITNLADDIKLSLAATSIRIEAPIPGKAAVGIEVPNPAASPVLFRELLEGDTFTNAKSDLTFAVGKDIAGKVIMADIGKMPHLLIAGATGSGKSVCINTLIMSILYKANPRDVKLIMIDPKVVELSVYNGIPHLFCPVVTDPKEAAAALNWAVREMGDRYNKFKEFGVRNIAGYNEKIKKMDDAQTAGYTKMPYLVVIVDEFADLMMVASKDVEDAVCRLAQLARAAGIHLVLATQRPSVNVITGVIKANIPSRIAFSVSSATDSRTILDRGGAEKLLGKGDMLFFPTGYSEPIRVQGAFVSDKEVGDIVDFLRENNETPEYNHAVTEIVEEAAPTESVEKKSVPENDEYFEDAARFVIESDRAAAGQLQRRFSIGFNRAGRIIDQLHKAGIVGPAEGTKPRKVLMTMEEFEAMLHGTDATPEDGLEEMVTSEEMEPTESAVIDTEENVATMEDV